MSGYPDAEDYVRAVQDPAAAFGPPLLKQAQFELHPIFGIPMPASGNAAVVFRASVGGRDTALRFFVREDASSRERYAALGSYFTARGLEECVAHPTWLQDAITVNGARWPVVEMSWVDGRTLDAYVGHLAARGDSGALSTLAGAWRALVDRLQEAEFAHGDLQHGNVLVDTGSALKLVDFDGSWIAALDDGPPPKETGHPNYQRTGRAWGRWMDTFPALVIYTSLLALARRPGGWQQLSTGENILFSATDFQPPFRTPAWEFVAGLRDAEVDRAAGTLMRACDPTWTATGPLESLLDGPPPVRTRPAPAAQPPAYYPGVGAAAGGTWWSQPAPAGAGGALPGRSGGTVPGGGGGDHQVPAAGGAVPAAGAAVPAAVMPPPPPKAAAETGSRPSFAGVGGSESWYGSGTPAGSGRTGRPGAPAPGASGPAGRGGAPGGAAGAGRPAPRSASTTALLVLLIMGVAALVSGAVMQAAGGPGGVAALLVGPLAGLVALALLTGGGS